ncbi:hypothetical protein RRF57_013268 [Xylaria bambusicola]|uniref:Uncharacterized protein n=1 Tax=Xylaria bambusicola TaxID=326684 RepID=A0AAN7ZFE0_9PEZI
MNSRTSFGGDESSRFQRTQLRPPVVEVMRVGPRVREEVRVGRGCVEVEDLDGDAWGAAEPGRCAQRDEDGAYF